MGEAGCGCVAMKGGGGGAGADIFLEYFLNWVSAVGMVGRAAAVCC